MPRPKAANAAEPKKRSRNGCWPCKARKVKCGEEKPNCANCVKQNEVCDYSIRLQWGGRSKKDQDAFAAISTPNSLISSPSWTLSAPSTPSQTPAAQTSMFRAQTSAAAAATGMSSSRGSGMASSTGPSSLDVRVSMIDPQLTLSSDSPQSAGLNPNDNRQGGQMGRFRGQDGPQHTNFPRGGTGAAYQSVSQTSSSSPYPITNLPANPQGHSYGNPRSLPHPMPSTDFEWSDQHRAKRVRRSPSFGMRNSLPPVFLKPDFPDSNTHHQDQASPSSALYTPFSASGIASTPNTPGSSIVSDETTSRVLPRASSSAVQPADLRRLSVNSLLSGPPGDYDSQVPGEVRSLEYPKSDGEGFTIYGYDYGYPDLDVSKNNDAIAIIPQSPATTRGGTVSTANSPYGFASESPSPTPSKEAAFQRGGYYAQPVPIKLSTEFEPLPSYLTSSPMNLLYFHHFLNHTARVLTPHDCPDNPLRTILPKMAIHNPDLMNLIFAYSASHRARLLSHPEPKSRIAYWVRDVFPNLRHALSSDEPVSDATLATAILLASREIITPNTFDVNIPWQNHLGIARQMIIRRGGLKDMGENGCPEVNFMARWFAYLDVIGSLSGHKNDAPLSEAYWSFPQDFPSQRSRSSDGDDHGFAIDCFFGFTNCCISLLARVAKLAHECDKERIDSNGEIDPDWAPSDEVKAMAEQLIINLSENNDHVYAGCRHRRRNDAAGSDVINESERLDLQEIVCVNEAFHLAGLIHIYRRVLGRQSADREVQKCVTKVLLVLEQVRRGGTAESCLLFPMFTAGCDATEEEHRSMILERLKLVEGLGMPHVQKARALMETSWETGKPWETLASGEFFG